ncbi:MAG: HAMP domain-containing sensor histidine kinase [Sulfurimonas sp.]
MKDKRYSTKYAIIYTALVSVILLTPLFFYFIYMKNIHSIQNELFLKDKSFFIIGAMEEHDNSEEYFEYPRFRTFNSGLYDKNFKPIFSLVKNEIKYFKNGYHVDKDNNAFLIIKLPKERYFGAKYLVVTNKLSFAVVYEKIMIILFSVLVLIFILSMFFLRTFARPFKRLNQTLDTFIKDSMHEINTPLSIINVNIDLFVRKNGSNKYLERMKAASKVLSNIYNDMDYLIQHERVDYKRDSFELSQFLKDRVDYFDEVALMKNIKLNLHLKASDLYVYINQKQIQKIIDNTISNAIKYSYDNSKIDIEMYVEDEKCYLVFNDYGVGIYKVSDIFNRYYRENKEKGGFGIGLNIVKSIIDELDIELKIKSTPKVGSQFMYIIPKKYTLSLSPQ